jgi:hypothetical protein
MIIAGWRGFEVDSSEGYYVFDREMEHVDDGWRFLKRLLASPLVRKTVAFSLRPRRGGPGGVDGFLAELRRAGRIRAEKPDEFSDPIDIAPASDFLALFREVRADLASASIHFALVPPERLERGARAELKKWFFLQFANGETARLRWSDYLRVEEKDIRLSGCTELTNGWTDAEGLEATFEINLESPFGYRVLVPAVDPTLIVYLLRQITDRFRLVYEGEHGISIDLTPDHLAIAKPRPEAGSKDYRELVPGPGRSLPEPAKRRVKVKNPKGRSKDRAQSKMYLTSNPGMRFRKR